MLTGNQTYRINVAGYRLLKIDPFDVQFPDVVGVDSVTITTPEDRVIEVNVRFSTVASKEEARQTAKQIAWRVADRLAFQYGIAADDPIPCEQSLRRIGDPLHFSVWQDLQIESTVTAVVAGHIKQEVGAAEIPGLQTFLPSVEPSREAYYRDYRWTLQQSEPVARYLHLYRLLLNLTRNNGVEGQRFVDAFIATVEPGVQMVTPPQRPPETIYTSLRNEVAHDRGAAPEATKANIHGLVDALENIAKRAILHFT